MNDEERFYIVDHFQAKCELEQEFSSINNATLENDIAFNCKMYD